ncbi:HNH endonuclease [Streptomyces sp. M2CJ-2]|uniref:HNH endonuclease n=1 Tax=Streptomyces sp. M2CJ-2 TaxID=2803948 RepID=UPI001924C04B|nr:HNH endonuclease signature motif containing protein [Streptomyces sp. M2CJ-2]MBL3664521.1 HNH endonuclease [Streptomyces sp. M2CJ-2]
MHYQRVWKQERSCVIDDCTRPYAAKGFCVMHYKRARKGQPLDAPALGSGKAAGCRVEGCERPYHGNGYCGAHLQRLVRTGDPEGLRRLPRAGCLIDGCGEPHWGQGYCSLHYGRVRQYGGSHENRKPCRMCNEYYVRPAGPTGSYVYCPECTDKVGPHYWAAVRRIRLASNNVGMSDEDRSEAAAYRQIIAADPCVYCGKPSTAVDHIEAVTRGGSDRWENLAPVCKSCNSKKRARSVLEMLLWVGAAS